MPAEDIRRIVEADAPGLGALNAALDDYAHLYRVFHVEPKDRRPSVEQLGQSAERVKEALPQGKRSFQQAMDRLKAEGRWNGDLDAVVHRNMVEQIDALDVGARERMDLERFLTKDRNPRENLEAVLSSLDQLPSAMDADLARLKAVGPQAIGAELAASTSSALDPCFSWFMAAWMCMFFFIMVLPGAVACFIFGVIVVLAVCV